MKRFLLLFFALALFAFAKVNINTASASELESLKGIGKSKATAIIDIVKQTASSSLLRN
ncbi:hypothetical protein FACS1894103_4250 [Campylobacterota bacterium]|nr:hypothetical protein FACS1894103_4250 [Campylobacterota bacterium]